MKRGNYRILTLHTCWAWAIAHAGKDVENRSRAFPTRLLGSRILIHAGATEGEWRDAPHPGDFNDDNRDWPAWMDEYETTKGFALKRHILAIAHIDATHVPYDQRCEHWGRVEDKTTTQCSPWAHIGSHHWMLTGVRALREPVPFSRGALSLQKAERFPGLVEQVEAQL